MKIHKTETEFIEIRENPNYNPNAQPWELKTPQYEYRNNGTGRWLPLAHSLEEVKNAAKVKNWGIEK